MASVSWGMCWARATGRLCRNNSYGERGL